MFPESVPSSSPSASQAGTPRILGFFEFTWLFFVQPVRLHHRLKALGVPPGASMWELGPRLREPAVRAFVLHSALLLFLITPLAAAAFGLAFQTTGLLVNWVSLAVIIGFGVGFGVAVGIFFDVAFGIGFGVVGGVAFGIGFGVGFGAGLDVALSIGFGVAVGIFLDVAFSFWVGEGFAVAGGIVAVVLFVVLGGATVGGVFGVLDGIAFGVGGVVASCRLPTWILEAPLTWCVSLLARSGLLSPKTASKLLPFRAHDLIYLPLPGLRSLLVSLGDRSPSLAGELLSTCAESVGQKRAARLALHEMQARSLELAGRDRLWESVAEGTLRWLPRYLEPGSPCQYFRSAARELRAAGVSDSHRHQRLVFARAAQAMGDFKKNVIWRQPTSLERLLLPVAAQWLRVIENEQSVLERKQRENPQLPTCFVVGSALTLDDHVLFKGRRDLTQLIDHEVVSERRAPLFLWGQRRMGKSSFLNQLDLQLGGGMRIVRVDFGHLDGSPLRRTPHRWVIELVAKAVPGAPPLPDAGPWLPALEWLVKLEPLLQERNQRCLVAIDEVENLQDGIAQGWTDPGFLRFVRAAGDQLRRIRFLLVSAHPLERLGHDWTDRLISAVPYTLTYLEEDAARELVTRPCDGFPDIYPEGGVQSILSATHCQPHFTQAVCDALVRRLNADKRFTATSLDVERAIDQAYNAQFHVLQELWQAQTADEQAWLRRLAGANAKLTDPDIALTSLERYGYVESHDGEYGVAVPLFARWIRQHERLT